MLRVGVRHIVERVLGCEGVQFDPEVVRVPERVRMPVRVRVSVRMG